METTGDDQRCVYSYVYTYIHTHRVQDEGIYIGDFPPHSNSPLKGPEYIVVTDTVIEHPIKASIFLKNWPSIQDNLLQPNR